MHIVAPNGNQSIPRRRINDRAIALLAAAYNELQRVQKREETKAARNIEV